MSWFTDLLNIFKRRQPTPAPTPTPVPTPTPTPTPEPPTGPSVVFSAPFSDSSRWVAGRTWAYPNQGKTVRVGTAAGGDNKLDLLNVNSSRDGTFYARKQADGTWLTDLLTTENAPGGEFRVQPGDTLTATVTLNAQQGAWPAIWTGAFNQNGAQPGNGEVDLFEYHGENGSLLEITNHVVSASKYVQNIVLSGVPFELKTVFGLKSVDTYVNGVLVFADGAGVPATWSAALIVNISVSAGAYGHAAPPATAKELSFKVENLKVWR